MLELHQFALVNNISFSPFCHKVEIYCKLAGIPFTIVPSMPNKAPKGKLPFIVDNGKSVADSSFILNYLKERRGDMLDHELTPEQKALGHLIKRTCEESLSAVLTYSRWIDNANWPLFRSLVFSSMPPVIGSVIPPIIRRSIQKMLHFQGYGRHSQDEIYQLGKDDLQSLESFLNHTPFAVSQAPTSYDATLFAFLFSLTRVGIPSPLQDFIDNSAIFNRYIKGMEERLRMSASSS